MLVVFFKLFYCRGGILIIFVKSLQVDKYPSNKVSHKNMISHQSGFEVNNSVAGSQAYIFRGLPFQLWVPLCFYINVLSTQLLVSWKKFKKIIYLFLFVVYQQWI